MIGLVWSVIKKVFGCVFAGSRSYLLSAVHSEDLTPGTFSGSFLFQIQILDEILLSLG